MLDIRIKDLMIPLENYPHVLTRHTLLEAAEVIRNSVIMMKDKQSLPRFILVIGNQGDLMGMVTRRDILRGLEPTYLLRKSLDTRKKMFDVKEDPKLKVLQNKKIVRGIMEQSERTVNEIMRNILVSVNYDDHIFKAIYIMNENNLSLLPVLKDSVAVGVVRTVELFNVITDDLLKDEYIW